MSGENFLISSDWLNCKGHDLEDKIVKKWHTFERLKNGCNNKGSDAVKYALIKKVISDKKQYLSKDFELLFRRMV